MIKRRRVSNQRSFGKNAGTALAGFLAFFVALFLLPLATQAAGDIPTLSGVVQGSGLPMVNLTVFLLNILRIFFGLLGVIAVALLIYGGFIWMTAGGDPSKVDKAKQIIYNTIIGLVVIFSAFAISSFLMAWLKGMSGAGGGGGTSNIPGGNGDWSRSAIGAGPIQSVFPAPNAVNVPINTRVAVTFKVNIKPESICNPVETGDPNVCDGDTMKNVSICESSATSSDCLADSAFNAASFEGSTVYQSSASDFKTFIIYPKTYLGADDQQIRVFRVTLENGITAAATSKSVFDGLRLNYYNWAFKTNGSIDLTPPEVAKLEIYPNPDNTADAYSIDTQATTGSASVEISNFSQLKLESPPVLNGTPFLGTALNNISTTKVAGDPAIPANYLKLSTAGFDAKGAAPVTIAFSISSAGDFILFDNTPDAAGILGINYSTVGVCKSGNSVLPRCLPVTDDKQVTLTGSGIVITSSGNFSDAKGSRWSFTVAPAQAGDTVVLANGAEKINFVFAAASLPDQISRKTMAADGRTVVTTNYFTVKSGTNDASSYAQSLMNALNARAASLITAGLDVGNSSKVNISPKAAGANALGLAKESAALVISGNLSGTARVTGWTPLPIGSKPDPYNNSVFRVSFTEAINPINVDSFIKVRINGVEVLASTTLTNQYRTVELMGTHECGVNSCGKTIYCWLDPNAGQTASVPASTEIIAAGLKYCSAGNQDSAGNEWCKKFGGACQAGVDNGRCRAGNQYYPQAASTADGVTDMANNSFNGNFDKVNNAKGNSVGNAQGQSGAGNGRSGQPAYSANSASHFDGLKFSFANDGDANGDNFIWSFFISTQVDTAAPLIARILPYGDYSLGSGLGESFRDPVRIVFNGLMRLATLQPGWGYGEGPTDPKWNTRYLTLKTITSGANPVGYWVSSANRDDGDANGQGKGDGLADFTEAAIYHNPFDQAVSYGPLAGNGIESITQNCFLPGNGPISAGANDPNHLCRYNANGTTEGCVTDLSIDAAVRVTSTNPSSYGYMNCKDIDGASKCTGSNKICKVQNAASADVGVPNGSWVVTKDCPGPQCAVTDTPGGTGCCFGKCF